MIIRSPDRFYKIGSGERVCCQIETCGHDECAELRAKAIEKCRICKKPLGFNREIRENPDGPGNVHQACLDRDARVSVVRSVGRSVNTVTYEDTTYRLYLSCGHEDLIRLRKRYENGMLASSQKMPRHVRCQECAKLKRDVHGRKREDADWIKPPRFAETR